jgi:hypothetical protein
MASRQNQLLATLYSGWLAALAADPEMPLDELRALFEHWGDVNGEPGGVDYIETEAGGPSALWAEPKGCTREAVCEVPLCKVPTLRRGQRP